MGADLITVMVAKPSGGKLDWVKAHTIIDAMALEDFGEEFLWVWGFDDLMGAEEDLTVEQLREVAHDAFKTVERDLAGGARYLNIYENYLGSGVDFCIVGERTWGDAPEGHTEWVTLSLCEDAASEAGFVFDLSDWS